MNSETSTNKILRAVLYERLSKEDGDKLTKEEKSESIKNPKTSDEIVIDLCIGIISLLGVGLTIKVLKK